MLLEKTIKAITLRQPWATLVAIGAKQYETRSWGTTYRGPLAIHAAKGFSEDERDLCKMDPFRRVLRLAGCRDSYDLPTGAVICVVDLIGVYHTETISREIDRDEFMFGNYTEGRFAWKLANVRPIPFPIRCSGSLGLWNWEINIPGVWEG